ncbi:hypothetical protein GMA11_03575 [Granulicatella sp. zg-ZJ]|uniref:competence protein ComK n=1 Tax=Granulicatella sp. zg-ZJ TaxID=2678504 RepID=UPI0013D0FE88|nr:competence protein ComK [Granulicatella sp. zg-ZJ]NEW62467.1 hypothetical protein [Granulicatella sp. zg-ZJ]
MKQLLEKLLMILEKLEGSEQTLEFPRNYILDDLENHNREHRIIDQTTIQHLFFQAKKVKSMDVDDDVYAIIHLGDEYAPYKSMLLSFSTIPLISKESTNGIMSRLFIKLGIGYHQYCDIIKMMFNTPLYRLPYIYGGKMYLPASGPTKQSCTWYALHHILKYTKDSEYGDVLLTFKQHIHIKAELTKDSFQKQLERANILYQLQQEGLKYLMIDVYGYDSNIETFLNFSASENVVTKYQKENRMNIAKDNPYLLLLLLSKIIGNSDVTERMIKEICQIKPNKDQI